MAAVPATTMDGRPSDAVDAQTRQAIAVRVIGALPSCLIACVWIGPWLAGALFAAIAAYELILARPLQTKFVVPHLPNDPNRAERAGAVLLFIGSVAHTAPFAAAWIVGGQEFAFIAALFLFGTMVHAMTFYGGDLNGSMQHTR